MTENLATQFVEDNGEADRRDPEHVYKMSLCFIHGHVPPNMIDIASNFFIHQESPVLM